MLTAFARDGGVKDVELLLLRTDRGIDTGRIGTPA
jgi:hypothetical protein